jgi:hypothetical protein
VAKGTSQGDPIAVIGEAHAGSAALTRVLLEIDDTQPDGAPSVTVWFLHAGEVKPPDNTAYPLGGRSAADLHPFDGPEPFMGFPTFGEYVRQKTPFDRSLRSALPAPTYGQIDAYMQYVLDLAMMIVRDKARLEVDKTRTIESIHPNPRARSAEMFFLVGSKSPIGIDRAVSERMQQQCKSGPVTIDFTDGTSLDAKEVIYAKHPPHIAELLQHLSVISRVTQQQAWDPRTRENTEARRGGPLRRLLDSLRNAWRAVVGEKQAETVLSITPELARERFLARARYVGAQLSSELARSPLRAETGRDEPAAGDLEPIDTAAKEVMLSLDPFIRAAQANRSLPEPAWLDPFVLGYVLEYCFAALQKVLDSDPSKLTYPAARVFMKVYAGLNAPWSRAMKILATGPDLASGSEAAAVVLAVFAGTPGYKHDDRVHEAMQVPFESQRFGNLLPTRLHPYSEHYHSGKHVKFALFTRRLMELDQASP